jgi:hypothetical protein
MNSVNGHKRGVVQVRLERGEYTERSENKTDRPFLDGGIDIIEVVVCRKVAAVRRETADPKVNAVQKETTDRKVTRSPK